MDLKRGKTLEDQLFRLGLVFLAAGCVGTAVYLKWILPNTHLDGCMWDKLFGIYCPGCGGTRALRALLHGRLLLSLWYHPLVLYGTAVFGTFMISQTLARITGGRYIRGIRFHNWYLYGAIVIIAVNFIVKNILRYFWDIML